MSDDKAFWDGCSLEQWFADDRATECLAQAESNPDTAAEALRIAAGYIRRGEVFPGDLAQYIVEAIEIAMEKPKEHRAKALTDELNLTRNNRRPAGDMATIGCEVERLVEQGRLPNDAFLEVATDHNISVDTVRNYWKQYEPHAQAFDAEMMQILDAKPKT